MDPIKEYIDARNKPLAQLRANGIQLLAKVRGVLSNIATVGVSIGISPRDEILNNNTHAEINLMIYNYLSRVREGGRDARCPMPPPFLIIGEYSPQHRWHYHGAILVHEMRTLDRIKRYISRKIGRCVTGQISFVESYVDYCIKTYNKDEEMFKMYMVFNDESYVTTVMDTKDKSI